MKLLLILSALFVAGSNGVSLFGTDCGDRKVIFGENSNACAVVYEDDDCDGSSLVIPVGYTKFRRDIRNDVESLMVRPGCVLIGYSNNRGDDGNELFEGDNFVFDALSRRSSEGPLINSNLDNDELDNDMESADCYCTSTQGVGTIRQLSSSVIEGSGFFDSILGRNRASRCNEQIAVFNRPVARGQPIVAAMVYDKPGCHGRMREIGVGDTTLSHLIGQDLDDDVESVMVRPGCKFVGTDHSKTNILGAGARVTIDATRNSAEPKAKNLSGDGDLEDDISAVEVTC